MRVKRRCIAPTELGSTSSNIVVAIRLRPWAQLEMNTDTNGTKTKVFHMARLHDEGLYMIFLDKKWSFTTSQNLNSKNSKQAHLNFMWQSLTPNKRVN